MVRRERQGDGGGAGQEGPIPQVTASARRDPEVPEWPVPRPQVGPGWVERLSQGGRAPTPGLLPVLLAAPTPYPPRRTPPWVLPKLTCRAPAPSIAGGSVLCPRLLPLPPTLICHPPSVSLQSRSPLALPGPCLLSPSSVPLLEPGFLALSGDPTSPAFLSGPPLTVTLLLCTLVFSCSSPCCLGPAPPPHLGLRPFPRLPNPGKPRGDAQVRGLLVAPGSPESQVAPTQNGDGKGQ